jgi:hypothetical protein
METFAVVCPVMLGSVENEIIIHTGFAVDPVSIRAGICSDGLTVQRI